MTPLQCTFRPFVAAIVAVLILTACAVGPNYRRSAVVTPKEYKEAHAQTATASIDDKQWWHVFGDSALDALEQQVEVSNQNLAAAEAAYRQASALVREQRAALLPTFSADASGDRVNSSSGRAVTTTSPGGTGITTTAAGRTQTIYQADIGASWELDVWGRLRRTLEGARATAQASAADLAAARLSNQSQLATSYLQLREADAERRLVADTVTGYAKALQVTQNRYAVGVDAKTDVLQAQTQLADAQAQEATLTLQRMQLEHAIADLIGKAPADFTLAPQEEWHVTVPEIPAGVPSTLLQRRPDIAAAERRTAAANAAIGVQEAAYFPSLTLTGAYSFASSALSTLFDAAGESKSARLGTSATLFDWGARGARVAGARASYDQAVAQYRQTVIDAFRGVEDQLAAAAVLAHEYQLRKQQSAAADETESRTLNQYKAGRISYTDVVVIQAAALNARRSLASTALSRQIAAVSLVTALGGGWSAAAAQ
jgi:NodT family efflux transporter outer membrane factor (OMF) lipoprotein